MVYRLDKWLLVPLIPIFLGLENGQVIRRTDDYRNKAFPHPFYVSVTEIHHNEKDKRLEISSKIFADDLEDILKQSYKKAIDLSNEKHHAEMDSYVRNYLRQHLQVRADGKPVVLNYLGFEKESESVYCYLEVENVPLVKKIEVVVSILQDFTDQQINIVHVSVNGTRKSYKLDFPQKEASFSF